MTTVEDAALIQVVILGAARTGKTTILNRLVDQKNETEYTPTIGVDFFCKNYTLDGGDKKVKCQIWDTAGQERFQSLLDTYIKSTSVVIFVYSIDDSSSFKRAKKLCKECKELKRDDSRTVYYLIGNKADLIMQRQVLRVDGEAFAQSANMTYVEMCANDDKEVKQFFERLVHNCAPKLSDARLSSRSFTRLNREKLDAKFLSSNLSDTSRSLNLDNRNFTTRCNHHKIDVNSNSGLISGAQSARRSSNEGDASRIIQEVRI